MIERKGEKYYNHCRGSDIIPAEGDVSIMLNHIQYLSPEYADIILDYLAYNVQFSGQKIHWALLIQGKQGTGKSAIGLMMSKILGEHNVVSPDNEKIHEKYTEWQINKLLVVIEELMAKNRVQLINKLKPMITQGVTDVREMYTPSYEIENCYNFLIFTNHRDAIFLEKDDRRYCIIFSDAEPKDKAYYNQLFDFIEKKAGFFLYYLQKRDLSGFNPKGHAPMTAAKQFLLEDSLHPIEKAINALTESNTFPFNGRVAPTQEAATAISNFLNDKTIKGQALSKHLCSAGYQRKDKQRLEDKGNPVNFWLKSGAEMTLDAIKQEYQRQKDIFGSDDF